MHFIEDLDLSTAALSNHDLVSKVFLHYNTALLSSVHIKQAFNVAGDVFTRKQGKITEEENFEKWFLVKNVWRAEEHAQKELGQLVLLTEFVQC